MNELKKVKSKLTCVMLIIGAAAIAACAYGLLHEIITDRQGTDYYSGLMEDILVIPDIEIPLADSPFADSIDVESEEAVEEDAAPVEKTRLLDFEALREKCPDAVAWVRCEGTPIDYPIVQGEDNEYYLSHLPDGNKNKVGSIFVDYRNSGDFSDKNTLVYGHRVKGDEMFSTLKKYGEQMFYDEHPVLYLYAPDANYIVELYAGYVIDSGSETPPMSFSGESDFERYIVKAKRRSVFKSDVSVSFEDRLLTLCTCDYSYTNARFILIGKLVYIP